MPFRGGAIVPSKLSFKGGVLVAVNKKEMKLAESIPFLNKLAGRHGIALIDIFEDGIMDLKSRQVYKAPAATEVLTVKIDLGGSCFTKDERHFKKIIDAHWASMVYRGEWFHPLKDDLDAFIEQSQQVVSGTTQIKLYRGNFTIVKRERSASSLFYPEIRSRKAAGFDQCWCAHAAKIRGLPFEILAKRNAKMKDKL